MPDEFFASQRSRLVALLLAFFLGVFGFHRFYLGKVRSGVLMLLTLGGLGLWWLYDLILIATGAFRDGDGLLVSDWEPEHERLIPAGTAASILDELDQLRAEVSELNERVDFAERLLADPNRPTDRAE